MHGAPFQTGAWNKAGSGGWTTDVTLAEAVETLAEQDNLEVTEAEVLDLQRRGKITLYQDKDGAWRMDRKNFALLKLALGLSADVQPAAPPLAPQEYNQSVVASASHAFLPEAQDRYNESESPLHPRSNEYQVPAEAANGLSGLTLPQVLGAEPKPEPVSSGDITPRRGEIRAGIAYGVVPPVYTWVSIAECAVVSGYSAGHISKLRRQGAIEQMEGNLIPTKEALRLYQALQQALHGTAETSETDQATAGKVIVST